MASSTLTSKGQITLPRDVRERLQLAQGDRVTFMVQATGDVVLRRAARTGDEDIAGILRHLRRRRPASVAEMNMAVRRRARVQQGRSPRPKRQR